jgi:hypothetical protein
MWAPVRCGIGIPAISLGANVTLRSRPVIGGCRAEAAHTTWHDDGLVSGDRTETYPPHGDASYRECGAHLDVVG